MSVEEQLICRKTQGTFANGKVFADESAPEQGPRDKDFHVKHIRLEIELDVRAQRVAGTSTLTLTPINDGLRKIELDAVDLTIRGVRGGGKALPFDHANGKLAVTLAKTHKAGQEFTLAIRYEGKPKKGLFFILPDKDYPKDQPMVWSQGESEDNKFWFPCYEAPNDKMTSEVAVTVPRGWKGVPEQSPKKWIHANTHRANSWPPPDPGRDRLGRSEFIKPLVPSARTKAAALRHALISMTPAAGTITTTPGNPKRKTKNANHHHASPSRARYWIAIASSSLTKRIWTDAKEPSRIIRSSRWYRNSLLARCKYSQNLPRTSCNAPVPRPT